MDIVANSKTIDSTELLDSTGAALFIFQGDKNLYVNSFGCNLTGYSEDELLNMNFWDIIHPEFQSTVKARGRLRQNEDSVPNRYEVKIIRKDGTVRWLDFSGRKISIEGKPAVLGTAFDITVRKEAEKQLSQSLKEKEILIREIHHRVKNNLQIISSLLHLQAKHIKDENVLKTFQESQNRVHAMALAHEALYRSRHFSKIEVAGYFRTIAERLIGLHGKPVHVDYQIEETRVDLDIAMPLGLIFNELFTNSLKHAFSSDFAECEVQISWERIDDGQVQFRVRDNGDGMDSAIIKDRSSLGLHLVQTLVEQLEGKLEISGDNGTVVDIFLSKLHG